MSRLTGPSESGRLVFRTGTNGQALTSAVGSVVTVYADQAGTTLADIQTTGGSPITGAVLTVGGDSLLPLFLFPDGVDTVWAVPAGGLVTYPLYAREDDRLDAIVVAAATEAATRAAADAGLASAASLTAETSARVAGDAANAASIATTTSAISAETTRATAAEALKAPLASPALTGTPTINAVAAETTAGAQTKATAAQTAAIAAAATDATTKANAAAAASDPLGTATAGDVTTLATATGRALAFAVVFGG